VSPSCDWLTADTVELNEGTSEVLVAAATVVGVAVGAVVLVAVVVGARVVLVAIEAVVAESFAVLPASVVTATPEPHPAIKAATRRSRHNLPRWRR